MKTKLLLFAALFLIALPCLAADVTLQWDPHSAGPAWESVRAYEISGGNYTQVGEVTGTETQLTITGVTPGAHTYVVRSVAQPWGESADSNQATTPDVATPPTGVHVTVTVSVTVQ